MWDISNSKFTIAYSFLNCQNSANGMAKYILRQQEDFYENHISYIYIYSIKKTIKNDTKMLFCKYGVCVDGKEQGICSIEEILYEVYQAIMTGKKMCGLHIHHTMYSNLSDLKALVELTEPAPIYFYLHDFYTICTQYNLLRNNNEFCGKGSISEIKCSTCNHYAKAKKIIPYIKEFLYDIKNRLIVIAPSNSTAEIWKSAYSGLFDKIRVVPHKIVGEYYLRRKKKAEKVRIAFLGRPVEHKGWKQWRELVEHYGMDERFEFYVLGNTQINDANMKFVEVATSNEKPNAMVEAIIENEIDICFIWSLWPETFSYTCIESIEAGAMIFTNVKSGNVADLTIRYKHGIVFENFEELLDLFKLKRKNEMKIVLAQFQEEDSFSIKNIKNNDSIIQDFIGSENCSSVNKVNYRRFDIMPKWLIRILII